MYQQHLNQCATNIFHKVTDKIEITNPSLHYASNYEQ